MLKKMKGRREGETGRLVPAPPERGNAARTRVWECQSRQWGAQWGAEGLLGRMHAKGIVGNYTGLERASNALIQQDSFIKKQGCWTGTQRAREINLSRPFFSQLPGIRPYTNLSFPLFCFCRLASLWEIVCAHGGRGEKAWGCWRLEVLLYFSNRMFLQRWMGVPSQVLN